MGLLIVLASAVLLGLVAVIIRRFGARVDELESRVSEPRLRSDRFVESSRLNGSPSSGRCSSVKLNFEGD